ncbi:MAG TPA: hypothetical protein DEO86_10015, partial [Colwellia sp.]|nr:hypothetical protein [Colwellia sp.]
MVCCVMEHITLQPSLEQQTKDDNDKNFVLLIKESLGAIWTLMIFYIVLLLILSFSRLALILWQAERTLINDAWLQIMINGFR